MITGDHALVKIGISGNPQARLAQLQTSSPFALRIVSVATYNRAAEVETAAHKLLEQHRQSGEWFACTPELAIAAVAAAAAQIGAKLAAPLPLEGYKRPWWHRLVRWITYGVIALVTAAITAFVAILVRLAYS